MVASERSGDSADEGPDQKRDGSDDREVGRDLSRLLCERGCCIGGRCAPGCNDGGARAERAERKESGDDHRGQRPSEQTMRGITKQTSSVRRPIHLARRRPAR